VIERRDGDRLQHFASEFNRSRYTQPPLIAWSLARLAAQVDDARAKTWIENAYEPLRDYHHWLRQHRRLESGLYAWAHAYESGVENAPRFSSRDEGRLDDIRKWAAPDLSAYVVLQCEALAGMAQRLGRVEEKAEFEREAASVRAAMNALLWDEKEGLYFDRDMESDRLVRSHTIASLLPLWAGVPDQRQAARMHERIASPQEFASLIPLPSVSLSDPDFVRDMWRGPVWLNTAFAVVEGLRRYGFDQTASEFAWRLCDGVYRAFETHGHFYEFYDPTAHSIDALHRKRGNRWKKITLGSGPVADFVGWTGLVNTMLTDHLFGLSGAPGERAIAPRFPAAAHGLALTLDLPEDDATVAITVGVGGTVEGRIDHAGKSRDFTALFGERVSLHA
jgi:hypothetical protein